ncbi:MAG: hypothetical protein JOZ33_12290 [Acidobacteriaceae bacterium]|nr:hypothetical protein [Acidobacteriaceae bacterium]
MKKMPILLAFAVPSLSIAGLVTVAVAQSTNQSTSQSDRPPAPAITPAQTDEAGPAAASNSATPPQSAPASTGKADKTIEVPAGTKVLLALRSGVNTKTAQPGDGVYLSSTFPVVSEGHVVIPSGVYVQGVIDNVVRPGRVKGRAQVTMHFTTLIFPNGSVVSIPGAVDSLPGSDGPTVKRKNGEGTIEQAGSKGKDAGTVATSAATGAGLGGIIGAADGHPGEGVGYGAAAGAVGGILYTLFTRGNEVVLPEGQTIEMVFQRPLQLQEANLATADGNTTAFVPTGKQPQPLPKPNRSQKILCPLGNLGCQ